MWVEFVVGFAGSAFSPGTPVLPSPQKPTFQIQIGFKIVGLLHLGTTLIST